MGKPMVGKTTLINIYTRDVFIHDYNPTIEDTYRRQVLMNQKKHILDILDTSGNEEYSCLHDQHIESSSGFILMCDSNDEESFELLEGYYEKCYEMKDAYWIPIVVVSNKRDLKSHGLGAKFCKDHEIPFFEVDLQNEMEKVEEIFYTLAKLIKEKGVIYNSEIKYFQSL